MPAETLTEHEPLARQEAAPAEPSAASTQAPARRLPGVLVSPQVRVGLLAVAGVAIEAVLARTVLDVELNFFALLAPFFVFTAYKVSGQRGRTAEVVASVGVVAATATVLIVHVL